MARTLHQIALILPEGPRRDALADALGALTGVRLRCFDSPAEAIVDRTLGRADVVLTDFFWPRLSGGHQVRALGAAAPEAGILVLLPADRADGERDALQAGANDCVRIGPDVVLQSLQAVARMLAHPETVRAQRAAREDRRHLWAQTSLERTDLETFTGGELYDWLRESVLADADQRAFDLSVVVAGDVAGLRADRQRLQRALRHLCAAVRAEDHRAVLNVEVRWHGPKSSAHGYLRVRVSDVACPRGARRLRRRRALDGFRAQGDVDEAARLVSLMDGDLHAQRSRGTVRFEFLLPVLVHERGRAVAVAEGAPDAPTALVIHSRGRVRRSVANELRRLGVTVLDAATAGQGERLFRRFSERGETPSVVFVEEGLTGRGPLLTRLDRVVGRRAPTVVQLCKAGGALRSLQPDQMVAPPDREELAELVQARRLDGGVAHAAK